jgi:hypothetical protein
MGVIASGTPSRHDEESSNFGHRQLAEAGKVERIGRPARAGRQEIS